MKIKKISIIFLISFTLIGLTLYNADANEIGFSSSKNLVKNINSVSNSKLTEDLKKTEEYKDEFFNINIKKFESEDVAVECDEDGNPIL